MVLKIGLYTYTSNYLLLYQWRLGNLALCESLFKVYKNPSMEFALVQLFSTKKAIFSCKKVAIVALLFFFSFLTDFDDLFDDDDLQWSKKHFKILLYSLLGLKYVLNIVCKLRPDYLTFIWFVQLYFYYTGNKKSWFIN